MRAPQKETDDKPVANSNIVETATINKPITTGKAAGTRHKEDPITATNISEGNHKQPTNTRKAEEKYVEALTTAEGVMTIGKDGKDTSHHNNHSSDKHKQNQANYDPEGKGDQ